MNKKGKLSASMMCAGLDKLFYFLTEFKEVNLEYLHIDIMDGQFVPNFALGTDYVKSLRRITEIPFDYHFLVNNPLEKMSWFDIREGDQVSFHFENNDKIQECIDYLTRLGARKFIAINPKTNFHELDEYFPQIDGILVMHTPPGFAGKKLIPETIEKVGDLRKYLNEINLDLEIESDGNVSIEHAEKLYAQGSTIFVSGTSSLFMNSEKPIKEIIIEKRKVIGWK
ncbi:ribulose-phosphate 3-epimerase [Methanobrevibacter millerae]|uniref:Ribulose-phosphate 3-epimerase n=1 Tax=Methanobrevibacter millerae TaxID=230361 RepID=A0A1G5WWP8_9EURY|nr:ribulose-phosphate 3-epimerase [Methanobrevibacter millerae]SDA62559.1 ribulose-phosphate 3-epimerase [Methanobrevibacter millerae]